MVRGETGVGLMSAIDVVEVRDFLTHFHWGRHPDDPMLDMRLGGGAYAVHRNGHAVVIDSMARPGQGQWVRDYLARTHGVTRFTLVCSHWHVDHIVDNVAFADDVIVGHAHTREVMLARRAEFEAGYGDYDPFTVVPPNLCFEGRLDLWVDDIKLELHEVKIHEAGHLGVLLPEQKILLASDLLEDPLWFFDFDFAPAGVQRAEFDRLRAMDIEHIYPCHGSVDTIRRGGYSKRLIDANAHYIDAMLQAGAVSDETRCTPQRLLSDYLEAGVISWWEPYAEVHAQNREAVLSLQGDS